MHRLLEVTAPATQSRKALANEHFWETAREAHTTDQVSNNKTPPKEGPGALAVCVCVSGCNWRRYRGGTFLVNQTMHCRNSLADGFALLILDLVSRWLGLCLSRVVGMAPDFRGITKNVPLCLNRKEDLPTTKFQKTLSDSRERWATMADRAHAGKGSKLMQRHACTHPAKGVMDTALTAGRRRKSSRVRKIRKRGQEVAGKKQKQVVCIQKSRLLGLRSPK